MKYIVTYALSLSVINLLKGANFQALFSNDGRKVEDTERLRQEVTRLKTEINELKSNHPLGKGYSTKVGFTAYIGSPARVNTNDTLVCKDVRSNIGGLYDKNTGVFQSDRPGMFVFFISLECKVENVHIGLHIDNKRVGETACFSENEYNIVSFSFVHNLSSGSKVWINVTYAKYAHIARKTSFGGYSV
ncbi:uncharacterized protein LOC134243758 [Saccostrea cucullata]|uniref:uncharacterized protein LOC134243758 n=1 Tax=Saccostrea cuccullata TaxID=36930 RepID=UPI002ED10950